jgi:hypothetical protein
MAKGEEAEEAEEAEKMRRLRLRLRFELPLEVV